jgi:hypothetical protein
LPGTNAVIYGGKEPFPVSDIHISIVEQPLEFIVLEKNRISFISIILVEEKTDINRPFFTYNLSI